MKLKETLNIKTISAGVLAAIFGCTGPALIVIGGAQNGGLTQVETISWLFAIYFFGGILGIFLSLRYRQPIAGAYSIPAAVLVAGALTTNTLSEATGAYLIAGIIVLLLGISGMIGKVMRWIPVPIVMAMIVGAMISFGTDMILSIEKAPLIAGTAVALYLLSTALTKKVPAILPAFIGTMAVALAMGQFSLSGMEPALVIPQLVMPTFSFEAIISLSIPLALLVIGAENAQATGVLISQGYKPPINMMTIFSGVGGILTSLFGGHNANIAGPMTAICASEEAGENKEKRYGAVIVNGTLFALFGIFAGVAVPFVTAMPGTLVGTIAGLAMIGVLLSSLQAAFSETKFQIGAFFALIIGISGISFFGISAPFWSILGGVAVSLAIEQKDFKETSADQNDDKIKIIEKESPKIESATNIE
ncbi:benzoate/H(+) symporter BenE family transporter [Salinicoccus halodurans]|uniref:Benzoate membrane transport protein n=1 Tax=Salinicoccus halodurans TaxID=407035 RepID=A0A0F7HJJ2_9STAP|nr:benzoate/H(+) symporter BenE family transporter [Salinicoccus halodurans]AKG73547.1 benzoate transporter [Salinicoccus halodurans]SFK52385.1 benzoate membrane transport protein [Salinicoccus halodurans]